jgi:hypothetical protein
MRWQKRSIPALSRTCTRKMPSKAALLERTRAQRIPFRPGVRYSDKGRIHSRRPILSSSLFACKTAADHTCRGRDDPHGSPPAQIRTSASTHTALLKNEWRGNEPGLRFASRTPSKRWVMLFPAQSQEHVRLNDVLLQLRPSLPNLRRSCRLLVRLVHRYYGTVRLLQHVHVRLVA